IRELGGVFGVAVLASIFAANGSYQSGQAFVDGMIPAMQVGAVVVAAGALAALGLGGRTRVAAGEPAAYDAFADTGAAAA
ncbi:MAG: MFS transporter, partial [Candidatus Limnocylindrales bacterium]